MEPGYILGLSAVTLTVIGVFLYLGLKLSRYLQSHAPASDISMRINLSGTVLFASLVAFWILCMIARQNYRSSAFGSFLRDPEGLAATIVMSIFVAGVIAALLERFGHPVTSRGDNDS